jgi:uncharacterized protein YabN with tetrapyrrole methylase and pyrophosphatase domain
MTDLISYLFNVPLYPELASIIVSKLNTMDYTMLHFTSKELRKYTTNKVYKKITMCERAAETGYLNVLKWARENNCSWNDWACHNAAYNDHLNVLKYLREYGCPWDKYTCYYAVETGHLDVLKWARENGCPWDDRIKELAAEKGYIEL